MPCPSCWQSGNTGTLGPDARPGPISSQLMILPCFCSHSAFGTTTIPFPLQAFWPAQLPPAPAHAPLPLHSLMPVHFTLSPPALSSARAFTAPLAKSVAAAVAMRMPLLTRFIDFSFPSPLGGRPPGEGHRRVAGLDAPARVRFQPGAARSATPSGFHAIEGADAPARGFESGGAGMAGPTASRRCDRRDVLERAPRPLRLRRLAHDRTESGHPDAPPHPELLRRSGHDDHPAREQGPAAAAPGDHGAQLPALRARSVELPRGEPAAALDRDAALVPHRPRPPLAGRRGDAGGSRRSAGRGRPSAHPHAGE